MTIGGAFLDTPSPDSWIGYRLASRYGPAMAGYKNPHVWTGLSRQDPGFKELVEFAMIEAPPMDKNRIAAFRLGARH